MTRPVLSSFHLQASYMLFCSLPPFVLEHFVTYFLVTMVTSRSAAGCLLGRERRAGNRPAVYAACNYSVFSLKLNCNKSLLSAPPNTPSADTKEQRPARILIKYLQPRFVLQRRDQNIEAMRLYNKWTKEAPIMAQNPVALGLHPFFIFLHQCQEKCCLIFFPKQTKNFLYSTFSSVWSKQRTTMSKQDWFSCFPQSDKVTASNSSLGAFLRVPVGFYRATSASSSSPRWTSWWIVC